MLPDIITVCDKVDDEEDEAEADDDEVDADDDEADADDEPERDYPLIDIMVELDEGLTEIVASCNIFVVIGITVKGYKNEIFLPV